MAHDLMYIELKTGYSDDGPAWIGYVKASKSGKTLYFNDHAFQKCRGTYSNYRDIESGEAYWISGLIGCTELPSHLFDVIDIEDSFPVERVHSLLNEKAEE